MGITSTQITERLRHSTNIPQKKQELFERTRYFIAQKPAVGSFSETTDGYYKGRRVTPGPRANRKVSPVINVRDIAILESQYFIRFVDNATTENADESMRQALFTIMDDAEADDYERELAKLYNVKLEDTDETVSSKTTK